jgi:protocatechuate 3,4-dioxygenase, beta subunit
MKTKTNRRDFFRLGIGGVAGGLAGLNIVGNAMAETCGLTPPQTSGPFYPGERNFGMDTDLTRVPGRTERAAGQVVYVRGRVLDQHCRPVANANVEIWQASASGRYNNPKDPNPAPLDPNFKYWAETFTNASGEYLFKTIIPGAYPAQAGWDRPPHIHFKVSKLGHHELVTQMYFAGDALNDRDYILLDLSPEERQRVVVDFKEAPMGFEPGSLIGDFNISLRTVRQR